MDRQILEHLDIRPIFKAVRFMYTLHRRFLRECCEINMGGTLWNMNNNIVVKEAVHELREIYILHET